MNNKKNVETDENVDECEQTRRSFLKKYGKLAVVTPVALTTLMSPKTSHAVNSDALAKFCATRPTHHRCRSGF
ncbi:hypothetical protein RGQ13_13915 [Thalassotalea psychrophila]|uniref:Uncharacterized protein n=1 Tax=Thalassotalea psychrophila TaxID=3065647 RepID=A0ABY9TQW8_9GAMM|nr:hypothetical protein RGQ13_13915 [Colwelliaceae bacterium SQ149]